VNDNTSGFQNELKINDSTAVDIDGNNQHLKAEEIKDMIRFPFEKLIIMVISYIFMLTISFLKGSDHFDSLIGIEM